METYYPAELPMVLQAWAQLHGKAQTQKAEQVDPMTFFGDGGERIDS